MLYYCRSVSYSQVFCLSCIRGGSGASSCLGQCAMHIVCTMVRRFETVPRTQLSGRQGETAQTLQCLSGFRSETWAKPAESNTETKEWALVECEKRLYRHDLMHSRSRRHRALETQRRQHLVALLLL